MKNTLKRNLVSGTVRDPTPAHTTFLLVSVCLPAIFPDFSTQISEPCNEGLHANEHRNSDVLGVHKQSWGTGLKTCLLQGSTCLSSFTQPRRERMCLQPESTRVTYFLSVWPALPFQKAAAIPDSTVSCFIVFWRRTGFVHKRLCFLSLSLITHTYLNQATLITDFFLVLGIKPKASHC